MMTSKYIILLMLSSALVLAQSSAVNAQSIPRFITRSGDKLMDGANEYRFIGVHLSTVHRNENDLRSDRSDIWPTDYEIEDQVKSIAQMGGTATRIYVLSFKRSSPNVDWHVNALGNYSETGFRVLDKVLQVANIYGVRVIVPFIDKYDYELWGGTAQFATLSGKTGVNFYTDTQIKSNFKSFMNDVVNRTNYYTGVKYKDDKAILAWQLGNELNANDGASDAWSSEMAAYLKSVDPNHLVADARALQSQFTGILNDPNIDIVDKHVYGLWDNTDNIAGLVKTDRDASRGKKPLIVGEFGYAPTASSTALLDQVIADGTAGALLWTLRGHHRDGGFRSEDGDFSSGYRALHWPGFSSGTDLDEANLLSIVRNKAYQIRGISLPSLAAPSAPAMLTPVNSGALSWQGSAGAQTYTLERATTSNGAWTIIASGLADDQLAPLYRDYSANSGASYFYRVTAQNQQGSSPSSNVVGPINGVQSLLDPLTDFSKTQSRTNVLIDSSNPGLFQGDNARVYRSGGSTAEEIVWNTPNMASFEAQTHFWPTEAVSDFTVQVSSNGNQWTNVTPTIHSRKSRNGIWTKRFYSVSGVADVNYVKFRWNNLQGQSWSPQIGSVNFSSGYSNNLVDDLIDWSKVNSRSTVDLDTTNPSLFGGDTSRARRAGASTGEEIVWQRAAASSFEMKGYFWPNEPVSDFTISTSSDGTSWQSATPAITQTPGANGAWTLRQYALSNLTGVNYVKVRWNNLQGQSWSPQVGTVNLTAGSSSELLDNFNDLSKTYSRGSIDLDTTNPSLFGGDISRARRASVSTAEEIVWQKAAATSFDMSGYFWPNEPVSDFTILTSSDGTSWQSATPVITQTSGTNGGWTLRQYSLANLTGVNFVKVRWGNISGQWWSPQISSVRIR
jgi:hypothetical protein